MNDSDAPKKTIDEIHFAFFNLAAIHSQGLMRLSNALRHDPNVSDETRMAAENLFASVDEMIDNLKKLSTFAWGVRHDD